MLSTNLFLLSLVASINAIPVPNPQTPDFRTLDTCPTNGAIVCSPDGSSFYLCNFGRAVPMGKVAAGTTCMNGKIVTIGASAGPTAEPEPTVAPTYVPEPTTAEMVKTTTEAAMPTEAPEPPQEEVTSYTTVTQDVTIQSTTVVLVTKTGRAPDTPSETSAPEPVPTSEPSAGKIVITKDIILKIGPDAKSCPRDNQYRDLARDECATAEQAAPFITEAFDQYGIKTVGEAAAILSLMMYETGAFQFNRNHFGGDGNGNPGQGTRNMMSPNFILQYAQTFGSTDSIKPGLTPDNILNETAAIKNKVLELVLGDDKTWATGAWFYKTYPKCGAVMSDLQKTPVSIQAWQNYITNCVETGEIEKRVVTFKLAVEALGGTTVA